ncbi:MAG: ribonuclease Z [Gemmatimonadota bacterium]|nr:ribonuclease Z [Gemmatimonadota bacterium]
MTARLTVIGSGTLVPSADRASPCHLVESGSDMLLLDLGPGAVHGLARLGKPWWKISHVVLTHYHTDHIGDLPHLLFALKWAAPSPRGRPLHILGPPGLRVRTEALRAAHGDFIVAPGFTVVYEEIDTQATWTEAEASLRLSFLPTPHAEVSVAVRVDTEGGSIGYTGDTGPDPALGAFFAGVDVLVSECAYADPPPANNHLSPASVAAMARRAQPGTLLLTHLYPPLEADAVPALVRDAGYSGRVFCARDGQGFCIGKAKPCSS